MDIASLIELDLPTTRAPSMSDEGAATVPGMSLADIQAEAQTDETPVSTWGAPVSAGQPCVDLINAERAVLGAAGLPTDDDGLFYEAGTALAEIGHANLRAYDGAFKALPEPPAEVARFTSLIADEHRSDKVVDLAHYRINAVGRLTAGSLDDRGAGWDLSKVAWRQLAEVAGGQNVNAGLTRRRKAERRVRTRAGDDAARREAFGIVSADPARGYTVMDGPEVADQVLRAMREHGVASGAKMEIKYDRETTRYDVRAVIQAPIDIPAFTGVGRVHQLFARVTGGDDGMTSIRGGLGALRIRCLNASLCEVAGATWSKRHQGQVGEVRGLVSRLLGSFGEAAKSLQAVWGEAAAHHYLDATSGSALGVREALERLVAHGHIPTGGLEAETAVDNFIAAWREEDSPTSAAGILMAVQRAAHESTWRTSWAQTEMEEAASHLLYQPVWALAEVEA